MTPRQKKFIADQLSNNETDSDQELIKFLTEETNLPKELITAIVTEERPKHLINPFYKTDFKKYNL